MSSSKPDRRVNRTRRLLRAALMALILEKGYDAVTVEDITQRADLGRTTFYLHYKDKEELLLESIETTAQDLKAQITRLLSESAAPLGSDPLQAQPGAQASLPIYLVFQHAADNADLYHIILKGEGATKTANLLHDIISTAAAEFFTRRTAREGLSVQPTLPVEIISNYFAGSLLAIITWWLERKMPYTAQQMTEMFIQLFFQGSLKVLGLRPYPP
jgi:AcrR family transcriptional regulator